MHANPIKEYFLQAEKGDFVVFEEGKHLFLLSVFETTPHLIIEEYSLPITEKNKITSWQDWVYYQTPLPTSHLIYEIDLHKDHCLQCYSFTKGVFLQPDDNFLFFRLTKLPFNRINEQQRKKVGPPPLDEEEDRRALWNPAMYFEGKKIKRPSYLVFRARWPEDGSSFSGAEIELYYNAKKAFAFPFCLQLKGNHMKAFVRALDAGKNLSSPVAFFPKRKCNSLRY